LHITVSVEVKLTTLSTYRAWLGLLHATQTGIAAKEKESKAFLMSLMTILEKVSTDVHREPIANIG
jgi:hypothetical protein